VINFILLIQPKWKTEGQAGSPTAYQVEIHGTDNKVFKVSIDIKKTEGPAPPGGGGANG